MMAARLSTAESRWSAATAGMLDPHVLLEPVFDNSGEVVDYRHIDVNDAACRFMRRSREELLSGTVHELMPLPVAERVLSFLNQVIESGEPLVLDDAALPSVSGSWVYFDMRVVPIDHYVSFTWRDVSERHQAAEKLKAERALLRATLDAAIDPQVYLAAIRDERGAIVDFEYADANPAAADYMRMSRDELVGARVLELLPGQAASGMLRMYARAVESGQPLIIDDYMYPHEILQSERRYDIRAVRVGDGLSFSWRDVTDRHEWAERLKASESRFRMLAENSSDVVMQVDLLGRIEWASPAALNLLGRDPDDVVGLNTFDLVREDYQDKIFTAYERVLSSGEDTRFRYPCRRPDGSSVWLESVGNLVRDHEGRPQFRVIRIRDIDDAHRAEEQLQHTRDRLRALTDSLLDPVVALSAVRDEQGQVVDFICEEANGAACREFRRQRSDVIGTSIRTLFGRKQAGEHVVEWCSRALAGGRPIAEDEVVMAGEPTVEPWRFDIRAAPFGESVSFLWREVTHRYLARQRLAASEEHYRLLAENVTDVVVLVRDGVMQWLSPSLTSVMGWGPEQLHNRRLEEFCHPDDVALLTPGPPLGVTRLRLRDRCGQHHWIEMNAAPFTDAEGHPDGTIVSFRIADAQVEAEQKLTYQASHDPLTRLLNRETALETLANWLVDHRAGTKMLVAFVDVDDLKSINDTLGHAAGDQLLQGVAARINGFLRTDDLVARIGGDELLMVMRGVEDVADGLLVLERMLLAVSEPLPVDGIAVNPSISVGLTQCVLGEDAQTAIRRADAAMYEAKVSGGNRIHVAEVE